MSTPSQFLAEDTAASRGPSGWRHALLNMGYARAMLFCAAVSISASVALSALLAWLRTGQGMTADNWIVAILVPALVSPVISHYGFSLLYEVAQSRALLHQAAIRDSLTRAYNRRFFMARLQIEVARAQREAQPLAVLMIDVDHFKSINDTHGHATGDQVLEQLAQVLISTLRPYDLVARYGGEEFVALMPGSSLQQAAATAERVRSAVAAMAVAGQAGGPVVAVTASVGASSLGAGEGDGSAMLERADRAMYAAKNGGRNRCVVLPRGPT